MPTERPARLLALPRDDRADLLLLALPNTALREACRQLQLTFPGYRLERVRPIVMADALAEEYETSAEDAAVIDRIVEESCPLPPTIPEDLVPATRIPGRMVQLLTWLAAEDPEIALAPLLWRLIGHPVESVRTAAAGALRSYIEWFDSIAGATPQENGGAEAGEAAGAEAGEAAGAGPGASGDEPQDAKGGPAASGVLRRQIKEAQSRATKLATDLEAARAQLSDERAHGARKDERLSRLKRDLEQSQADLRAARDAKSALEADLDRDTRSLLKTRESEAESLRHEVESLQRKLEEARRREADALAERKERKSAVEPPPTEDAAPAPAEAASPYQVPEFTPEFYESIEEWDDRILKITFEKVLLLASNFAHPSLDAKPMQGAEGLYRIKIGTDVRLLYRRKPNRGIEILSLIDRENLNRYVRQYKRRGHS